MQIATRGWFRGLNDPDVRNAWRATAVAFMTSRLVLFLVGWITLTFIATRDKAVHGAGPTLQQLKDLAFRWDTTWYISIARHGYSLTSPAIQPNAVNLSFWPAFPFLSRYLSEATGLSILTSGVILANLAFVLALYLLHRYCTRLDFSQAAAMFAVFLLAFVPESFLFSVFYGDAFGLLGMIGAMYYARKECWWTAGLFAVLASSSRPMGVMVLVFLVVHACQQLGWRKFLRPWIDPRPFVPVVLAPAGYFLMLWLSFRVSGDAFVQAHTRMAGWHVYFSTPWHSLFVDLRLGPDLKFWILSSLGMAASLIPLFRAKWYPDAIFGLGYFLLIFSQINSAGLLHYAAVLPVVYIGFAWWTREKELAQYALLGTFATLGAALFCAWTLYVYIAV